MMIQRTGRGNLSGLFMSLVIIFFGHFISRSVKSRKGNDDEREQKLEI